MGRAFGNLRLNGRVICGTSEYYHNFSVDSLLPDGTQSQNGKYIGGSIWSNRKATNVNNVSSQNTSRL